jgi:hypothetical protein
MSTTNTSLARRIVNKMTGTWAELGHAQRRMFEIQTGLTGLTRQPDRRTRVHNGERGGHL